MRNKPSIILFSIICLMLSTSCGKDDSPKTSHPDQGAVTLAFDWTAIDIGTDKPENFTVQLRGTQNVSAQINTAAPVLPLLLPGTYSALMYNAPEGFSITTDDVKAKATQAAAGIFQKFTATVRKAAAGNTLLPTPGGLFAGATDFSVNADDSVRTAISVEQQTRHLTLRLTVTEGEPGRIASVQGTLSGVAGSIRLASRELSEEASVAPAFTRNGAEITAPLNLLGVMGTQKLVLLLTYADGRTQAIESDLTEQLAAFNDHKQTALEVSGSLKTPTASGMDVATITDWEVAEKEDITIH